MSRKEIAATLIILLLVIAAAALTATFGVYVQSLEVPMD